MLGDMGLKLLLVGEKLKFAKSYVVLSSFLPITKYGTTKNSSPINDARSGLPSATPMIDGMMVMINQLNSHIGHLCRWRPLLSFLQSVF